MSDRREEIAQQIRALATPLQAELHALRADVRRQLLTLAAERDALQAENARLQEEARQLRLQRDAWQTLAAVRQGWAALQAPADRFGALCVAFAPFLPLEQQAAIVAALMGEQEGTGE